MTESEPHTMQSLPSDTLGLLLQTGTHFSIMQFTNNIGVHKYQKLYHSSLPFQGVWQYPSVHGKRKVGCLEILEDITITFTDIIKQPFQPLRVHSKEFENITEHLVFTCVL